MNKYKSLLKIIAAVLLTCLNILTALALDFLLVLYSSGGYTIPKTLEFEEYSALSDKTIQIYYQYEGFRDTSQNYYIYYKNDYTSKMYMAIEHIDSATITSDNENIYFEYNIGNEYKKIVLKK